MKFSRTSIRAMTPADLGRVRELLAQLGYRLDAAELERRFTAVSETEAHIALVAETDGRVSGFLHLFARPALEKPPEAIVQAMVVDEAVRRAGIGRALMARAEKWAAENGFTSVALSSLVERADAHAFYASLGYACLATSKLLRKTL